MNSAFVHGRQRPCLRWRGLRKREPREPAQAPAPELARRLNLREALPFQFDALDAA